jgi:hypothetical protein
LEKANALLEFANKNCPEAVLDIAASINFYKGQLLEQAAYWVEATGHGKRNVRRAVLTWCSATSSANCVAGLKSNAMALTGRLNKQRLRTLSPSPLCTRGIIPTASTLILLKRHTPRSRKYLEHADVSITMRVYAHFQEAEHHERPRTADANG